MTARLRLVTERALVTLKRAWELLREMSGDDAYDRYVAHHALEHSNEPLLPRRAFFAEMQRRKWSGITRCC
jgi:uncharacterized short protein YbdD (DUF466 family)